MRTMTIHQKDDTIEELMLLYLFTNCDIDFIEESLLSKKYINDGTITLSAVSALKKQVKLKEYDEKSIKELAEKYRKLFKGRKPGVMGDLQKLITNLTEFKKQYNYTDEQILTAAERYINSEAKSGYQYLQRADYTVKKRVDGVWESRLLTFCEELDTNDNEGSEEFFEVI